jgi:hypothetical protein
MTRTPVKSSNVVSIGHDPTSERLQVEFANGVYEFKGVSAEQHARLMAADSKGSHFHEFIKGKFSSRKL